MLSAKISSTSLMYKRKTKPTQVTTENTGSASLHRYSNISKDGIKIERLSFQEVVKQELILCKGPVAGTIYPGTEELVWD